MGSAVDHAGDDVGGGVGTEVLEEERAPVHHHVEHGHLTMQQVSAMGGWLFAQHSIAAFLRTWIKYGCRMANRTKKKAVMKKLVSCSCLRLMRSTMSMVHMYPGKDTSC